MTRKPRGVRQPSGKQRQHKENLGALQCPVGPEESSGRFFDDDDFIFTHGYDLIGDGASGIAVPKGTPLERKRLLLAAYKASQLGCTSVDYVLKMYGPEWDLSSEHTEVSGLVCEATSEIRNRVDVIIERVLALGELPNHLGAVAAYAALMRLQCSFKTACLLCEVGLSFEVFCICKLVLEQIAWAYAVHRITDESLLKVRPSECISHLKGLFPEVGIWYGFINRHSHMDTKVIRNLVRMENDRLAIVLRSQEQSLLAAFYVLRLADVYGAYIEVIWRLYYNSYEFIRRKTPLSLKAHRSSLIELESFRRRASECLSRHKSK